MFIAHPLDLNRAASLFKKPVLWLSAAFAWLAFALPVHASNTCGAVGERPCRVDERIPSCDLNLVEGGGQCVRPLCGQEGQRPCGTERLLFDFLLMKPVPQPCDVNLKLDFLQQKCVRPAGCGQVDQRACNVLERIPSCDVNLTEVAGRCVRPACGRHGERPCDVPRERLVIAAFGGRCDANLVLIQNICVRPGSQLTVAQPEPAAPPQPPVGTSASALTDSGQVVSGLKRSKILAAPPSGASPAAPSAAVGSDRIGSPWRINGNGYAGEVAVQQGADGTLGGTIYGNPLSGYYAPGERTVVWLRGAPAQPDQAFVGAVSADGSSISGRFYALTVGGGGGSPARNVFAFSALRGAAPGHPGVPAAAAGPASVAGTLALNANNIPGQLVLTQGPDGTLGGSIYGDRLSGHYAAGTGTIAFLRFVGAQPVQLYVGSVTAQGIDGEFYALTGPAGGSAQRMRYGWRAQLPQAAVAQQAAPSLPAPQTAVA
ncbi:MAG: hypothetical protein N2688_06670, partial [Burkholderiaceae bacterium]|nr:hypothetical protein [Burkholderiaceae bacterium]